jgi:hypothetical protein
MSPTNDPDRARGRREGRPPPRRSRDQDRGDDLAVFRSVLLAAIAGLAAVVALAALSVAGNLGLTAGIGISAVATIVSAAMGVAAAYFRRR